MKTQRPIRSHLTRWLFSCSAVLALAAAPLNGEVSVTFNNTDLPNTAATSIGTVTLLFTVDGSGNVTLDASTNSSATGAAAAVDAWDGAVGTITDSAAYNTSFTVTLKGVGNGASSNDLRICNLTGGSPTGGVIGIPGINQYRVDNHLSGSANNEYIQLTAASVPAGSKLKLTAIGWNNSNGNGSYSMSAFRTAAPSISLSNPVSSQTGTWDLSTSGVLLETAQVINFGTLPTTNQNHGYSFKSVSVDIVSASTLSAPAGLRVTTDGVQVALDWNDTTNATSYSVYRSTSPGGPYETAIATGLLTSDFTDTSVSTGSTYYYVVTASDGTTESADSSEIDVSVVIPAPTGLVRTQGDGVINLDWADSASAIFDFYTIYRSETQGGSYTELATGLSSSEYIDSSVSNGTTYYYVVTATDSVAAAESANSVEVFGTPFAAATDSVLYAHLDGSNSNNIVIDELQEEVVALWTDLTENGFDATSVGGVGTVFYPSLSQTGTGLSGLDMGFDLNGVAKSTLIWFSPAEQDQWLDFDSGAGALPYGGFTVFAVVQAESVLGGNNRDVVMGSTESDFSLRYEAGKPQVRLGNTVLESPVASVNAGQAVLLAVKYDASTGALQLWDSASSVTRSATVPAADFSSSSNFFLGGSTNPDQYMNGILGEAKVFRGVMTADAYLAERANLVEKWVSDPIPSGLTLIRGASKIDLQWNKIAPNLAYTYSVYRSEAESGNYTLLTSGLTDGTYSDTDVVPDVTYYYVVTSTNTLTLTENAYSSEVTGSLIVPELYAHLDASLSDSVTVDTATQEIVSLWADQTSNGLNASSQNGIGTVFYPSSTPSATGLNGLGMGTGAAGVEKSTLVWLSPLQQDPWLDFSSEAGALTYGGFSVFVVIKPESLLGGVTRDLVMGSTENNFTIRYENGAAQVNLGTGVLRGATGVIAPANTVVIAARYNADTGALQLWDSASRRVVSATVDAADFSSEASLFLGGSLNSDQYMNGMIGEVKLYRGQLSDSAFSSEYSDLTFKWAGLQAPSGFTVSSVDGAVALNWDDDQTADSFSVYRSEVSGGPYTLIAQDLTLSEYTDTDVTEDIAYYYVVSATESTFGESDKSVERGIRLFTPIPGSSLYVHLDATSSGTVLTTDGVVNTWQDLTANGLDALDVLNSVEPGNVTDAGDVLFPSSSLSPSGLAGLDFGPGRNLLSLFEPEAQDAWLDFSSVGIAQPYGGFAVFIALKADSILGSVAPDQARDVVFANADSIQGKFLIRYQSGRPEMYLNGVAALQGANRVVAGNTVILAANYNAATGALEFWDSAGQTSATATVPAADFSSASNIMFLGGSSNPIQRMDGMIGEVKIYRGSLTPTEFANERDSLVSKWITSPPPPASGFSAWQTANNTDGGADADHDGDGVANGVEFFLGGNTDTTGFTALPGVVEVDGAYLVTWNKGDGYSGEYGTDFWIESSTTLIGDWTVETLVGGNISDDPAFLRYSFPAPLTEKRFVRLKVVTP